MTRRQVADRFARSLRTLREARNLDQQDLAERSGLAPSAISHFETCRRTPQLHNLIRLADALGVSLERLVGRQPPDLCDVGPIRCESRQPESGVQCGLRLGHEGRHTVLIPTGEPWDPCRDLLRDWV